MVWITLYCNVDNYLKLLCLLCFVVWISRDIVWITLCDEKVRKRAILMWEDSEMRENLISLMSKSWSDLNLRKHDYLFGYPMDRIRMSF